MPNIFHKADENKELHTWLSDGSKSHVSVAEKFDLSEKAVRRWRSRMGISLHTSASGPDQDSVGDSDVVRGSVDVFPDGAQINNVVVEAEINDDWSSIFRLFNLNPDEFEVVDDTVRMSTWQQSKRSDSGERDTIQLWSYSARFRKVTKSYVSVETTNRWRSDLIDYRGNLTARTPNPDHHGTYVVTIADPQLGKKGTEEAVDNWKRGVTGHIHAILDLALSGKPVEAIHVAFMGDETEGVANNYGNQPHTVELNLSRQLELDFDLRVWTLRELATLQLPLSASSVISNHGEWTRNGSKEVVTTKSDNASTHIARQVQKMFDETAKFGGPQIDWTIGEGTPGIVINLSGVDTYFSHGYIEKGRGASTEIRTKSAIERQILGRTEEVGGVPLWIMAHYHHFYAQEFEGRTLFGCPALEAERSSEYMLDQYGVWSPPGSLGLVIGNNDQRGWSNLAVF